MPKKRTKFKDILDFDLPIDTKFEILRTLLAVGISLVLVMLILLFSTDDPMGAMYSLLIGPFTTLKRFANVIELMIPLSFTGLALTVVFKTNRFNLAADSAFFLGSMVALLVGLYSPFPALITIILALLGGTIAAGIVGWIPAVIRQKFGANELVTSLMLNYVVGFFVNYLFNKVRDIQKTVMQSYPLPQGVSLGNLIPGTRIHFGFIIMVIMVIVTWYVIYRTKWGYELRVTGSNEKFAKYSGMNTTLIIVLAQVIGTAIAGLGGAIEMLGIHKTFKWTSSPGYGFDGVIIATLARGNPALVPVAAFFIAYIRIGADILNRTSSLPSEIVSAIQATIILLVAAEAFLSRLRHRTIVKNSGILEKAKEN